MNKREKVETVVGFIALPLFIFGIYMLVVNFDTIKNKFLGKKGNNEVVINCVYDNYINMVSNAPTKYSAIIEVQDKNVIKLTNIETVTFYEQNVYEAYKTYYVSTSLVQDGNTISVNAKDDTMTLVRSNVIDYSKTNGSLSVPNTSEALKQFYLNYGFTCDGTVGTDVSGIDSFMSNFINDINMPNINDISVNDLGEELKLIIRSDKANQQLAINGEEIPPLSLETYDLNTLNYLDIINQVMDPDGTANNGDEYTIYLLTTTDTGIFSGSFACGSDSSTVMTYDKGIEVNAVNCK